jgi:hypothetical protein
MASLGGRTKLGFFCTYGGGPAADARRDLLAGMAAAASSAARINLSSRIQTHSRREVAQPFMRAPRRLLPKVD